MESTINLLLSTWLYFIAIIGVSLTALLFAKWHQWTWLNRLGALATIVLVLHVWEEWVYPGGFHVIYNLGSDYPDRYPMSQLTDMITNLGGVLLGCIVLIFWGFRASAGIAIAIFSLFEVIIHIFLGFKSYEAFHSQGQNILYSPGLITALFGFLPVAIGIITYFVKHQVSPTLKQWIVAIVALVAISFSLVNLPELLLKDKNSPYSFPDKGYYEFDKNRK